VNATSSSGGGGGGRNNHCNGAAAHAFVLCRGCAQPQGAVVMRMHKLVSICSVALVFALGASSTALANTYNLATLSPTNPLSISALAPAGAVNDNLTFDFTVANGSLSVYADLVNGYTQNGNHQLATGLLSSGNSSSFLELFSGSPTGAHAPV